jgi:hypothetical protein
MRRPDKVGDEKGLETILAPLSGRPLGEWLFVELLALTVSGCRPPPTPPSAAGGLDKLLVLAVCDPAGDSSMSLVDL